MNNIRIFITMLFAGYLSANAQDLNVQGDMYVSNSTTLTVLGSVNATGTASLNNEGEITLSGTAAHWKNDASPGFLSGLGGVMFNGSSLQNLGGNVTTTFHDLTINNTGLGIILSQDIFVEGMLHMQDGDYDLKDYHTELGGTGEVIGESELNRIKATGSNGSDGLGTGTIAATRILLAGATTDVGGLGLEITPVANLGNTEVIRGHLVEQSSDFIPTAQSIFRYYEVNAENTGTNADLSFDYFDAELNSNMEGKLGMYQTSGTAWVPLSSTSSTQQITASTNGFTTFTLSECEECITAIQDLLPPSTLSVYPNPIQEKIIYFQLDGQNQQKLSLDLYNSTGQLVSQQVFPNVIPGNQYVLEIPLALSSGVYLLHASTENGRLIKRVIVR